LKIKLGIYRNWVLQ